ncbi:Serine protease inhibitor 28Dc [Sergentomyia squamirostris]
MAKQLVVFGLVCLLSLVSGAGLSLDDLIAQHTAFRPVSAPQYGPGHLDPSTLLRRDVSSGTPEQHDDTAINVLRLAQKIGKNLLDSRSDKVMVYSPVSIAAALQLILLGSNGETYNELLKLLSTNDPVHLHENFGASITDLLASSIDDITKANDRNTIATGAGSVDHYVSMANGLFVQNGLSVRKDYRSVVESIYRSDITELDFERNSQDAAKYINDWVEKSTNGKIKNIVSQGLSTDTRVVVASTLYFNARWKETFIESATRPKEFYPDGLNGRSIEVDMMSYGGTLPFYHAREYNCRIIGLPYKNNLSTFYVIIPEDSNAFKLKELQASLTADKIDHMISRMTMNSSILFFPKMHLTGEFKLRDILSELGVHTLFDPNTADLSLISGESDVSDVSIVQGFPQLLSQPSALKSPLQPVNLEDREDVLIFSRLREDDDNNEEDNHKVNTPRKKRATYKVASKFDKESEPLTLKDFVLRKRITKPHAEKKLIRSRRQTSPQDSLKNLNLLRSRPTTNPGLFVSEVIHKVDLTVNEKGTEGGAATLAFLHKTGTDVVLRVNVPFLFLIRNEATKLPLFYGAVFEPQK